MTFTVQPSDAKQAVIALIEEPVAQFIADYAVAPDLPPGIDARVNALFGQLMPGAFQAFDAVWPDPPVPKRRAWARAYEAIGFMTAAGAYDRSVHPAGVELDRAQEAIDSLAGPIQRNVVGRALEELQGMAAMPEDAEDPAIGPPIG